jgi:hypothetical protein
MSSQTEWLKALKHLQIASYAFYVPTLALWIGLLGRMLISKDRDKFYGLIVVAVLIIVSFGASMVYYQRWYTMWDKSCKEDPYNYYLATQIMQACLFTTTTAFNLAHWFFAFSYLALSYRLELMAKKLP